MPDLVPGFGGVAGSLARDCAYLHGVDQADFELWCVAVSAINACGTCVDSHEKVVREKGLSEDAILGSVRIAAVVHGLAAVLDGEPVLASEALPV